MSWEQATLRDLCLPVRKCDPAATGRNLVRYIDIGSVDGETHSVSKAADVPSNKAPSRCRQIVKTGDTVFSTVRPYLEKIAYIDESLDDEFASTGFSVLRPGPQLNPRFLHYFTLSREMLDQILPLQKGVSYPAILDREVRSATMPVPPLREQHRIVAILEDHLSHLDAGEREITAAERRVDTWETAACDQVLWTESVPLWPIRALLRENMRNGRSDRAVKNAETGVRTLTLTAVTRNCFSDEHTKETVTPLSVAEGLWLEPGDIFIQRANTPELVGTAARFDGPRRWAIFPDLLIRLRADESRIDSRFLIGALRSERVHRSLRARAKGLAGSMPKIDQHAIAETLVPCPERRRQAEAVRALAEISTTAERLRAQLQIQADRARSLRHSLLTAAFSGRLTGSPAEVSAVRERITA